MIRVVIADDHLLLLDGLAQALNQMPDISVVGRVADGKALIEMVEETQPDVIVTDQDMPKLSGLGALKRMDDAPPTVFVTMHADEPQRLKAEKAGAVGFLSKGAPLPTLAAAVRAAAAGENFVATVGGGPILEDYSDAQLDPGAASLTSRERELLALLAGGVSSTEDLADRLYISQKTVKNHLASIYHKLAVSDRAQAAVEAIRLGITA